MDDLPLNRLAELFAENGNSITQLLCRHVVLFNVSPFVESFLGWDRVILSHFTIWDSFPIAELCENDVLSGGSIAKSAIREAVTALQLEEDRVVAWEMQHRSGRSGGSQMEWL